MYRKFLKRFLPIALSVAMVVQSAPDVAYAAESGNVETAQTDVEALEELEPDGVTDPSSVQGYEAFKIVPQTGMKSSITYAVPKKNFDSSVADNFLGLDYSSTAPTSSRVAVCVSPAAGCEVTVKLGSEEKTPIVSGGKSYYYFENYSSTEYTIGIEESVAKHKLTVNKPDTVESVKWGTTTSAINKDLPADRLLDYGTYYLDVATNAAVRALKVTGAEKVEFKNGSVTKSAFKVDLTADRTVDITAEKVHDVTVTGPATTSQVVVTGIKVETNKESNTFKPVTSSTLTYSVTGLIKGEQVKVSFDVEDVTDAAIRTTATVDGKTEVISGTHSGNKTTFEKTYTVNDANGAVSFDVAARKEVKLAVSGTSITGYYLDGDSFNSAKTKIGDFDKIGSNTKVVCDGSDYFYAYLTQSGKKVAIQNVTGVVTVDPTMVKVGNSYVYKCKAATSGTITLVGDAKDAVDITVSGDDKVDKILHDTGTKSTSAPSDWAVTSVVEVENGKATVEKKDGEWAWFQFSFKPNYELKEVKVNGTTVTSGALSTANYQVVSPASIGGPVKVAVPATGSPVIAVTSKQRTVSQTFNTSNATITVDKDKLVDTTGDALKANLVVTGGATETKALMGEKINFTVVANEGYKLTKVATSSATDATPLKARNDGTRTYYTVNAGEEVHATAEAVGYDVTLVTNTNVNTDVAYDIKKAGKSVASGASLATYLSTKIINYGEELTIKPTAADKYVISTVRVQKSGQTSWTTISKGSDGYYNIGKLTSNVKVDIKAAEDTSKQAAYSVTFDKSYVTVEQGDKKLESAKEYKTVTTPVAITVDTKAGYDSVLTIGTATQAAVNGTPVSILNKADDNKVVITTEAQKVTEDRFFWVETPSYYGVESYEVKTASGLVDPEKVGGKIVYQVDKSQKEVTLKVTLKSNYEFTDPYSFEELACKNIETVGVNKVYTFAIPVSILAKENETVKKITIPNPTSVSKNVTLTLDGVFKYCSTDDYSMSIGTVVTVELYKGYSLYQVGKATDADDKPLTKLPLTNQKYTFTISEDTTLKAVKDVETTYVTTVAIGKQPVNTDLKDEVEVNVNDVVQIQAYEESTRNTATGNALAITKVELTKDAKSVAVVTKSGMSATDLVKLTVAKEDAGKTITAKLFSDVEVDGATKEVQVGEVTLKIKALPAGVSVVNGKTAIKNKGSITLNAVNTKTLGVTFTPANVDKNYYSIEVESGKNVKAAFDAAKKNIIINTGVTAEEAKIMIKDNTKTTDNVLFTFTVKTVVQDLKVKSLASTAQGIKDINITLTGDKAIGQGLTLGKAAYYKVVVTPAKTSKVGTKAPTGASSYTYYIPFAESVSYKAIVNAVATAEDAKKAAWTYDFEASVIIANIGTKAGSTAPAGIVVEGKNTVKKSFNTKNAYYEDKLTITKKTTNIYNGQEDVLAGIVKFSKKASYLELTDATVVNADGSKLSASDAKTIEAKVDSVGNILVSPHLDCKPGKYNVVVSAEADNGMYAATATLPIVVKATQYRFSVDYPSELAVTGKNVSAKLKPTAYDFLGYKSAVQKFNYEIVGASGAKLDPTTDQNIIKNVSIKNGTLKVSKNFQVTGDSSKDTIYVKVSATDRKDYGKREGYCVIAIGIKKEATILKEIKIHDDSENVYVDSNAELIKSHQYSIKVYDADGNDVTSKVDLTPVAKWASGKGYTSNGIYKYDELKIVKAGKITIKATTTDGGKKSISKTVKVGFNKFTDMNVKLDFGTSQRNSLVGTNSYTYAGEGDASFNIAVYDGDEYAAIDNYNYKITVKGGNLVGFKVIPTSNKVTVTVKDQVNKKAKPVVVTVENTNVITAKAPKVTLTNKIYSYLYTADGSYDPQYAEFKVSSTEYKAVKLTKISGDRVLHTEESSITDGKFSIPAGYYKKATGKYQMIFGEYDDDGKFVAKTKPANVTVKVTQVDATKFKLNKSYTITPSDSVSVKLSGKPAQVDILCTRVEDANIKGASNNFTKLFKISEDGKSLTHITTDAKYAELMADKNNFTGYVTYSYTVGQDQVYDPATRTYVNIPRIVTKSEKIKVKINTKDLKYTATAATTMPGKAVTTTVKLGKNVVTLKSVTVATTGWTATLGEDKQTITLVSSTATAGTNNVTLKVVPKDSTSKDGISVTAKITVLDADKVAKKLTVKKGATTIDLAKADRVDGKLVYSVPASKVYTLVNGAVVKEIKAAEGTVDGLSIKLAEGKVVITADPAKLAEKKTYKFNAVVVFDGAAVDEKIAFTVKTPAYADMSATQTVVANALASYRATGAAGETDSIKAMLTAKIDPLTKITVESVTTSYVAARVSGDAIIAPKYEVCAQIKQGTGSAVAVTKAVKVPVSDSVNIASTLESKIVLNNTTPSAIGIDGRQLTTALSVQKYFEKAVAGTDNKVMITGFSYKAPVDGTAKKKAGIAGKLKFTVTIYNEKQSSTLADFDEPLAAKAYVAPTTN